MNFENSDSLYDYETKNSKHDAFIIDYHNSINKDFLERIGTQFQKLH